MNPKKEKERERKAEQIGTGPRRTTIQSSGTRALSAAHDHQHLLETKWSIACLAWYIRIRHKKKSPLHRYRPVTSPLLPYTDLRTILDSSGCVQFPHFPVNVRWLSSIKVQWEVNSRNFSVA